MHEANLGPQCSCDKCKREEKVFQRLGELEGLEWDTFDKLEAENAALKRLANDVLVEWNNWGIRGDFPNPFTTALHALGDALLTEQEDE